MRRAFGSVKALFFGVTLFLAALSCSAQVLSDAEYTELRAVVEKIEGMFQRDRYVVVGLGRSPTPIVAFLQLGDSGSAVNLPMSDAVGFQSALLKSQGRWTREKLFDHFDRFVPSDAELRGKDVVLIDFCMTGRSLVFASSILKKYFADRRRQTKVLPVPVTMSDRSAGVLACFDGSGFGDQAGNVILLQPKGDLFLSLRGEKYDFFAEYDSFSIDDLNDEKNLRPRQVYALLREVLRARSCEKDLVSANQ